MSLLARALTTVARQKTAMGLSGSSNDTLLEILINVCTDFIESYCSRRFYQEAYTQEVYDGTGTKTLLIKNYPIKSDATFTLQQRSSLTNEDDWETIDAELYHVDWETGIVTTLSNRFIKAVRHYRVIYTAGIPFDHATATLESLSYGDLEWACWELVKKAFQSRAQRSDIASESIGDYSVTFRESAMMDPILKHVLSKYVRADDQL